MFFNQVFEERNLDTQGRVFHYREAVRAVIFQNHKLLLVQSNKGDYKFPGGGVERGESHSKGLMREVKEETGYINLVVKDKIGSVIERKIDDHDVNALFQMTSHYYICELIDDRIVTQLLDPYELAQEFRPKWVSLEEAILQNETILTQNNANSWVTREYFVLKKIKDCPIKSRKA